MIWLIWLLFLMLAASVYFQIRSANKITGLEKRLAENPNIADEARRVKLRHDLKGHFNRIMALSKLIQMSGPVDEGQRDLLTKIEKECSAGAAFVNQVIPKVE